MLLPLMELTNTVVVVAGATLVAVITVNQLYCLGADTFCLGGRKDVTAEVYRELRPQSSGGSPVNQSTLYHLKFGVKHGTWHWF